MSLSASLSMLTVALSLALGLVVAAFAQARGRRELGWAVLACLAAASYGATNVASMMPALAPAAILASAHTGLACAALHVWAVLRFAQSRRERSTWEGILERALVATMVLALVPGLLYQRELAPPFYNATWSSWFIAPQPNALTPFAFLTIAIGLFANARGLVSAATTPAVRRAMTLAYLAFGACALNDILGGLMLVDTPYIAQMGFIPVVLALAYQLAEDWGEEARELDAVKGSLEERVAERTAELERANLDLVHQRQLAALGRLAASVGHEINNPLTYVRADVEQLGEPAIDSQQHAALVSEALEGLDRIANIVSELRVLAKRDDSAPLPVSLAAVVATVTKATEHLQTERSRLVVDDTNLFVIGKEGPLTQALVNLVRNGLQALPDDGEDHLVRLGASKHGDEILITVADDGVGIPASEREHLFEPFQTSREGGLGLGLAITHRIVTDAGGTIQVDSDRGRGTTFTIRLPAADAPPEPTKQAPHTPTPALSAERLEGRHVLVVDDERLIARVVARMLKPAEVTVASNIAEAKAMLQERRCDVVVSDLMMPGGSGLDLWRWLRTEHPPLAATFLLMTGGACDEESRVILSSGGPPWIPKPIRRAALIDAVGALLQEPSTSPCDA